MVHGDENNEVLFVPCHTGLWWPFLSVVHQKKLLLQRFVHHSITEHVSSEVNNCLVLMLSVKLCSSTWTLLRFNFPSLLPWEGFKLRSSPSELQLEKLHVCWWGKPPGNTQGHGKVKLEKQNAGCWSAFLWELVRIFFAGWPFSLLRGLGNWWTPRGGPLCQEWCPGRFLYPMMLGRVLWSPNQTHQVRCGWNQESGPHFTSLRWLLVREVVRPYSPRPKTHLLNAVNDFIDLGSVDQNNSVFWSEADKLLRYKNTFNRS